MKDIGYKFFYDHFFTFFTILNTNFPNAYIPYTTPAKRIIGIKSGDNAINRCARPYSIIAPRQYRRITPQFSRNLINISKVSLYLVPEYNLSIFTLKNSMMKNHTFSQSLYL